MPPSPHIPLPSTSSASPRVHAGPHARGAAFTLIEMIIVISIISVLLALLYGALDRAQKFSRRTIAYSELKTIEAAFKQYHAHYHTWPTNEFAEVQLSSGSDRGFIIDRDIAKLLQGNRPDGVTDPNIIARFNPEMLPFLELSRISPASGAPVNPFKTSNANPTDTTRAYKVLFDTSGDHQIFIPTDTDAAGSAPTNIIADIAVWTVIPGTRQVDNNGNPLNVGDVIFGSWQGFGIQN